MKIPVFVSCPTSLNPSHRFQSRHHEAIAHLLATTSLTTRENVPCSVCCETHLRCSWESQ
jgi:hypothetical protein